MDSLRDLLPALGRRLIGAPDPRDAEFWALRDVSFEVEPGQALGIIGANGAGKSTLLKLLSRILKPTRGHCQVSGRLGVLIDITAGFHPDLTGRENVYFQGAVMGLRRAQIDDTFDRIVEFSGVSEFLDTPVKHYSSGMHARLGFSIAAHLDPDVLLIDEILAVGDLAFQQKAFERLKVIARRDVPVVVVSHQLDRIATLCTHGILLDRGRVVCAGSPGECIAAYVSSQQPSDAVADGSCPVRLLSVAVEPSTAVVSGGWIAARIDGVHCGDGERAVDVEVLVRSSQTGQLLFVTSHTACEVTLPPGPFELEVDLQMNVAPGLFVLETLVRDRTRVQVLARGPRGFVHVRGGTNFVGTVQMNPRMRVAAPAAGGTMP